MGKSKRCNFNIVGGEKHGRRTGCSEASYLSTRSRSKVGGREDRRLNRGKYLRACADRALITLQQE